MSATLESTRKNPGAGLRTQQERHLAEMAGRFRRDVASHQMVPLRDQGLYRHLRFVHYAPPIDRETGQPKPGAAPRRGSFYWFDLVTWPGSLAINGDCGSYVFSRTTDMFEFFRGSRINPGYWAGKVQSGRESLTKYDEDIFRERVLEAFAGEVQHGGVPRGLGKAVREELLGREEAGWEDGAHALLRDFDYRTYTATCSCGQRSEAGLTWEKSEKWRRDHRARFGAGHYTDAGRSAEGFQFHDTWEWNLRDWDWQFLWCCHAIQWGIARYDAHKAAAVRP